MIQVTRSSMPSYEEYCAEIKDIWTSHWLTNMGVKHNQLQAELERFLDCPHVTLYTNGHLALENAIASFGFPEGGEVITSPFTFVSTTHAIVRNRLVPVFCDIDPTTFTIDVRKIEALITPRTVAIVPVHVYGNMCDVDQIKRIADEHHLRVIYDAAHAFAVTYKGVSASRFGDMSMFSFHATKVFNTIEGGAVCFSDDGKIQLMNDLKNFGIHGPEEVAYVGGNAKMNEFQAAMGICNLRHIKDEISKRKLVYDRYVELLSGTDGVIIPKPQKDVTPNYAYFPVLFESYRYSRDGVFNRLSEQGIIPRKYFYPLTNDITAYRNLPGSGVEKTPVAAHVAECVLTLPLYADLSLVDVQRICGIILS